MPKRPRSHIIEDLSRARLRELFTQLGWMVWDLYPDPGEDLLVRIFINGNATHYSFFVQAKSTDHIARYRSRDGLYLSFPIGVDHLKHWEHFWEPVILTIWDAKSGITYWEIIQDYLQNNNIIAVPNKKINVEIPITNILDGKGLEQILAKTKERFERFEILYEGAETLTHILQQNFDVETTYKPGDKAFWMGTPTGKDTFVFLSREAERLKTEAAEAKMDFKTYVLMKGLGFNNLT